MVGGANRDIIQDFVPGEDVLDLTRLDADIATPALDAFSWIGLSNFSGAPGQIRYQQVGAYVVVQADLNGDKAADLEIGLAGNFELTRSALLFPGRGRRAGQSGALRRGSRRNRPGLRLAPCLAAVQA